MDEKKKWRIQEIEFHETAAIQALNRGEATADQQKTALKCIIEKFCGYYDQQFDIDSDRITSFYLGRRDVAGRILLEIALNLSKLREKEAKK